MKSCKIKDKREEIKKVFNLEDDEAKRVLSNISKNILRVSDRHKDLDKDKLEKASNFIASEMIEDYLKLDSCCINDRKSFVFLKWGAYSRSDLIKNILDEIKSELGDEDIKNIKMLVNKMDISKLEKIYYDILSKFGSSNNIETMKPQTIYKADNQ